MKSNFVEEIMDKETNAELDRITFLKITCRSFQDMQYNRKQIASIVREMAQGRRSSKKRTLPKHERTVYDLEVLRAYVRLNADVVRMFGCKDG